MDLSHLILLETKARELLAPGETRNQISGELRELLEAIPMLVASLQGEYQKRTEAEALLTRLMHAHEETAATVQKARELLGINRVPRDLQVGDQVTKAAWGMRTKNDSAHEANHCPWHGSCVRGRWLVTRGGSRASGIAAFPRDL